MVVEVSRELVEAEERANTLAHLRRMVSTAYDAKDKACTDEDLAVAIEHKLEHMQIRAQNAELEAARLRKILLDIGSAMLGLKE